MSLSRLPSLTALRAFTVLAAERSYTRAAAALNVSHAAVGQQVRALEDRLGTALVVKAGRSIALTPDGEMLARELTAGFAIIRGGVEALGEAAAARPVQITMSPAFATEWLMPRITAFQYSHPGITLMLNPTAELVELGPGGIDMAVRYRARTPPGDGAETLLLSDMVVVGTPALAAGAAATGLPGLLDLPWLQELGTSEVADWMARRGLSRLRLPAIHHMPGNLVMHAVRRGDGITYSARAFVREEIAGGAIVVMHSEPLAGRYVLEMAPGPLRPSVRIFRDWLLAQAERVTAGPDAAAGAGAGTR